MTRGRMLNNANVVGMPDGTWYVPKASAIRPYRVQAVGGCSGCSGGLGSLKGPMDLLPNLFVMAAPVAIGFAILFVADLMGTKSPYDQ